MECQTKRRIRIIALLIVLGPIAAAQSNSVIVEQYSEEAQKALATGKYDEAQHAYERLRDLEPGTAEVHANLGLIYFHERLFEKAIASCRKALAIKPTLDATRALLAISLTELGRYSDGLPDLERAFRDSTNSDIKRMCGLELMRAYDNLQRESDAVEVGIALNRAFPDDAEILYQTGRVYGNYAFVTMSRLSQVAPHSIWRQIAAGEAAEGNGNFDQALIAYRAVLAMDPHHPGIHYRIARILESRSQQTASADDIQAAREEFEQELQIDPSNADAAYEIGLMYSKSGQFDKAKDYYEMALKYHPDFEVAELGMGDVFLKLGKAEIAIPYLRKAVEADHEDALAYYLLARAYESIGNNVDAREALAKFQRLREQEKPQDVQQRKSEDVTRQTVDLTSSQ
ncbi:MAG: tetratricopeptide repeat protein [Terracidiphilus sp.]